MPSTSSMSTLSLVTVPSTSFSTLQSLSSSCSIFSYFLRVASRVLLRQCFSFSHSKQRDSRSLQTLFWILLGVSLGVGGYGWEATGVLSCATCHSYYSRQRSLVRRAGVSEVSLSILSAKSSMTMALRLRDLLGVWCFCDQILSPSDFSWRCFYLLVVLPLDFTETLDCRMLISVYSGLFYSVWIYVFFSELRTALRHLQTKESIILCECLNFKNNPIAGWICLANLILYQLKASKFKNCELDSALKNGDFSLRSVLLAFVLPNSKTST